MSDSRTNSSHVVAYLGAVRDVQKQVTATLIEAEGKAEEDRNTVRSIVTPCVPVERLRRLRLDAITYNPDAERLIADVDGALGKLLHWSRSLSWILGGSVVNNRENQRLIAALELLAEWADSRATLAPIRVRAVISALVQKWGTWRRKDADLARMAVPHGSPQWKDYIDHRRDTNQTLREWELLLETARRVVADAMKNAKPGPWRGLLVEIGDGLIGDAGAAKAAKEWEDWDSKLSKAIGAEAAMDATEQAVNGNLAATSAEPVDAPLDQMVTLDQMAALVSKSKSTLRLRYDRCELPDPDVKGGGGKRHEWKWSRVRPVLEELFKRSLPELLPNWRQRSR